MRQDQSAVEFAIPTKTVVYLTQTILVVVFGCCRSGALWEIGR